MKAVSRTIGWCTAFLCAVVAIAQAPPGSVDPRIRDPKDDRPCLSADGKLLVWVRARDPKLSLCLLTSPFDGKRTELPLGPAEYPVPDLRMSLDGRHLFWNRNGLWHATLTDGTFGKPEQLPLEIGPFGLQTNADGSALATLVDGPSTPTTWPSWRAAAPAYRTRDGWAQERISPQELGKLAERTVIDASGRYLVYMLDGIKQARRGERGWMVSSIDFAGHNLTAVALSSDGQTMLLTGRKSDEVPPKAHPYIAHVWLSHRRNDQWQQPELILRDHECSYYSHTMSPDGRWLMWVEYERGSDGNAIVRSQLRLMRRGEHGWEQPISLFDEARWVQVWNTALANDGTAAWTIVGKPAWRGYVCPVGGKAVCLD